jgi:glyoxylase-like metal-dependent hydrolase (beta-lactamase superfamily II)
MIMPDEIIKIGNVELIALSDADLSFPPSDFFPTIPAEAWEAHRQYLGADGNLNPNAGCFVIRSSGQTIMVDTGYGPTLTGRLFDEMQAKGVPVEEISSVTFTHLHPDHVGWNMREANGSSRPSFPNARYLVPRTDFDFFTTAENQENFPYIKDQILPLAELGLIDFVQPDTNLTPEVQVWGTPGHTPGHVSFLISSGGERAVILGDVAHSPVQAHETDWNPGFDIDHDQSRSTRHSVLDRLEQEGLTVAAGHFPRPGFGKLVRVDGRRVWQAL